MITLCYLVTGGNIWVMSVFSQGEGCNQLRIYCHWGHLWIVIEAEWIIIGCDYELTVLKALLSLIFSSQFVQLIVCHIAYPSLFTRTFLIVKAKQIQCLKNTRVSSWSNIEPTKRDIEETEFVRLKVTNVKHWLRWFPTSSLVVHYDLHIKRFLT